MGDNRSSFLVENEIPDYPSRIFRRLRGWEALTGLGTRISLAAGVDIVRPGDATAYCYLVVEGRVVSMEYTADGDEHLFNFFEDGSVFLESNLLFDAPAAVWFRTLLPCELIRIPLDRLYEAMRDDAAIALFLLRSMSYKYYSAMDQIRNFYNYDASWKILNLLQLMAANFGTVKDGWVAIDIKITQRMIGNMLGINRITVGKVLKELKEVGVIMMVNGLYWVPNSKTLQRRMAATAGAGKPGGGKSVPGGGK